MKRFNIRLIAPLCLAAACACAHAPEGGGIEIPGSVRFQRHDGKDAFRIEPTRAGIRVEDASGRALAALRLLEDGLVISDPRGQRVAIVLSPLAERRDYHVVSPDRREVLYELHLEPDGDLSVYDAEGRRSGFARTRSRCGTPPE
jgi:hypothetical protein